MNRKLYAQWSPRNLVPKDFYSLDIVDFCEQAVNDIVANATDNPFKLSIEDQRSLTTVVSDFLNNHPRIPNDVVVMASCDRTTYDIIINIFKADRSDRLGDIMLWSIDVVPDNITLNDISW